MAAKPWGLEEEMSCPVCCDLYSDPVVLGCSNSFCRQCLDTYWSGRVSKDCPVCRRRSLTSSPPRNLALRNILDTMREKRKKEARTHEKGEEGDREIRGERSVSEDGGDGEGGGEREGGRKLGGRRASLAVEEREARCSLHGERLLLFCMDDQEALCMVCQTARRHKQHHMCPVEEAAPELKEEVKAYLLPLRRKLETFQKVKNECEKTSEHIKNQASQTEEKIKQEFEELHHFLRLEEAARLLALTEEMDVKWMIMEEKIEHLSRKVASLSSSIGEIEQNLEAGDLPFLQAYKTIEAGAKHTLPDPEPVTESLICVAKHLGNLRFRVWEKMQEMVQYFPVTFDPNTAAPWLSLSDDLARVRHSDLQPDLPDNPERCDRCVCVLGDETFPCGSHSWEVDVGRKTRWDLGVLRARVLRKGVLNVSPASGFWALALRDEGQYSACTTPWTRLALKRKPRRVRVCLDYEAGKVSFYDTADMALMYSFRDCGFSERLLPYFSLCVGDTEPLTICPAKVSVVIDAGNELV